MIALSLSTAAAIALHAAEHSWIVFVQVVMPDARPGPVRIEGVRGDKLGAKLITMARGCPFELQLVGMIATPQPAEDAQAIRVDFAQALIHDEWFEPILYVLSFIEKNAQSALQALLAVTHPGALENDDENQVVSIDGIAEILGVSVPTIRRMVKAKEIPFLKWNRIYRFVPREVLAALRR